MVAAALGYRTHRSVWVLGSFAAGILVLSAGRLTEVFQVMEGGVYMAVVGGGLILGSHLANLKHHRLCATECCE